MASGPMKGSKRPPEAEQRVQRVPFIAAPCAGLTSKPVGNMSSVLEGVAADEKKPVCVRTY